MTLLVRRSHASDSDETLATLARSGDDQAFAELYRRHLAAAKNTARYMSKSRNDVDDVVAEAFTGVLNALRNGRGPTDNFRAYLLACVRNGCYVRRKPALPIGYDELEAASPPALEDPEKYVEADTVARAFASLSPRWQRTLWLTEVEERPAAEVGERMQLAPNATAALSRRARQAFAAAYLSQHVANLTGRGCAPIALRLGAYVRDTLRPNERAEVAEHLTVCAACSRAVDELSDLNVSLRTLQTPVAAAGAGAAAVGTGIALSTTAGVGGTWAAMLGAGALVKVAALAVIVVPTVTFGIIHATESPPAHKDLAPAAVVSAPNGTAGGGAGSPVATTVAGSGGSGEQPSATTTADGVAGVDANGQPVGAPAVAPGPATGDSTVPGATISGVTVGGVTIGAVTGPDVTRPLVAVPRVTVPRVTVPGGTVPGGTVPRGTVPGVSLPPVVVPPVVVPPVQVPVLTAPAATVPAVTVPSVTIRAVTVPTVTIPIVTVPSVTIPAVTVPIVTVPTVTVPTVTVPVVTVPAVTVPPVTIPGVTVPYLGFRG